MAYDPRDWYWVVGGSKTQVFSSARGDYVPVSDAAYQAWLAKGELPTQIDSESSLGAVLAPYFLRPTAAGVLDAYKDAQAAKLTVETIAKIVFNHENRIRALEGSQPVQADALKTVIKGLM